MSQTLKVVCGLLLVISLGLPLPAQDTKKRKKPSVEKPQEGAAQTENSSAEKALTIHQQRALFLLDQLFESTKDFKDSLFKIRVQAQIADLLWEHDKVRARRQFEETFQAIDLIATPAQQEKAPSSTAIDNPQSRLRRELILLISRRDPELAERLMKTIVDVPPEPNPNAVAVGSQSEHALLYPQIARALADTDPQRAAQMVRNSLSSGLHSMLPSVLQLLQHQNPALADELFASALSVVQRDSAQAIANIRLAMMASGNNDAEQALSIIEKMSDQQRATKSV